MTTYIALLRGINVGGNKLVSMAELRALAETLGLEEPRTLLQSGNLVFRGKKQAATALERTLERAVAAELGVACDFVVRTAAEWDAIIAANPFPEAATRDPSHLVVMCLKGAPSGAQAAALRAVIRGREVGAVDGRQAYLVYPDGIGTSKLTNTVIESKLGVRGTARNWNTVLKLKALAAT
jgi:uncharacterized protein (DUF1697 family)